LRLAADETVVYDQTFEYFDCPSSPPLVVTGRVRPPYVVPEPKEAGELGQSRYDAGGNRIAMTGKSVVEYRADVETRGLWTVSGDTQPVSFLWSVCAPASPAAGPFTAGRRSRRQIPGAQSVNGPGIPRCSCCSGDAYAARAIPLVPG
jgi:hypothetical protein